MLNTENLAVYLIFTLILIIALFNVIGSMIMMILDKKKNLNTLYNLGTTIKDIKRIFFFQGFLMSSLGGIIGVVIGYILILNQIQTIPLILFSKHYRLFQYEFRLNSPINQKQDLNL